MINENVTAEAQRDLNEALDAAALAEPQTQSPAAEALMNEATILASTIAETLANGVLPVGLFGNEDRLGRLASALRDAIEVMGEEPEGTA